MSLFPKKGSIPLRYKSYVSYWHLVLLTLLQVMSIMLVKDLSESRLQ